MPPSAPLENEVGAGITMGLDSSDDGGDSSILVKLKETLSTEDGRDSSPALEPKVTSIEDALSSQETLLDPMEDEQSCPKDGVESQETILDPMEVEQSCPKVGVESQETLLDQMEEERSSPIELQDAILDRMEDEQSCPKDSVESHGTFLDPMEVEQSCPKVGVESQETFLDPMEVEKSCPKVGVESQETFLDPMGDEQSRPKVGNQPMTLPTSYGPIGESAGSTKTLQAKKAMSWEIGLIQPKNAPQRTIKVPADVPSSDEVDSDLSDHLAAGCTLRRSARLAPKTQPVLKSVPSAPSGKPTRRKKKLALKKDGFLLQASF